ncbi:MAG: hypothetical protein M4D80_34005 [Myxococcota bacterium]|nr:hypothetical protein [Myxococcota bacterium]
MMLAVFAVACHARPATKPPSPPPPPDQRVAASIASWGKALALEDDVALEKTEDRGGQFVLVYAGIKLAASHVPDGGKAVESTLGVNVLAYTLQSMWPGIFGAPSNWFLVVLPSGSLGPALVAAGLAEPVEGTSFTVTAIPKDETYGRLRKAAEAHRARLREKRAWTCKPERIEKTIAPTEPTLVKLATVSTTMFAGWLEDVDAIWLVRATCESGPALFVVTGHVNKQTGAVDDRIFTAFVLSAEAAGNPDLATPR